MKSAITSKFQTTIPKAVRDNLKLSIHDALEWKVEDGKAVVLPVKKPFLKCRNAVKIGRGSITKDVKKAREHRMKKFQ